MTFGTPELDNFFLMHDENYHKGIKVGYNTCKNEIKEEIKSLLKKINKLESFSKHSQTISIKYKVKL